MVNSSRWRAGIWYRNVAYSGVCDKGMIMEEWVSLISQVGFPIAITFWFMLRTEKYLEANTRTLQSLADKIDNCPKRG